MVRRSSEAKGLKRNEPVFRTVRFWNETLEEYRLMPFDHREKLLCESGQKKFHFLDRKGYNFLTATMITDLIELELEELHHKTQKPQQSIGLIRNDPDF